MMRVVRVREVKLPKSARSVLNASEVFPLMSRKLVSYSSEKADVKGKGEVSGAREVVVTLFPRSDILSFSFWRFSV